jgi:hypothetical protein
MDDSAAVPIPRPALRVKNWRRVRSSKGVIG